MYYRRKIAHLPEQGYIVISDYSKTDGLGETGIGAVMTANLEGILDIVAALVMKIGDMPNKTINISIKTD